ncbi:tubulin tyrosine ligase-like 15 [Anticarsia gemmatalis]|uniref:tubulin tyrosine ligase-like 15 n=1 Tax=Anticarsia gemmatalis TaxID=129554 RepID=UPI003F761E6F
MEDNNNESKDKNPMEDKKESLNNNTIEKENSWKPDIEMKKARNKHLRKESFSNIFLLVCIMGVSLGILLEIINVVKRNQRYTEDNCFEKPKYWVYSARSNVESRTGLLKHLHLVLDRIGFEKSTNNSNWDLLWSHDYPFSVLRDTVLNLKPHQRVNKFPGSGFLTNKVDLATSNSKYIPKAFRLPKSKEDFLKYAEENRNSLFVIKDNQHRGVYLKNVSDIDISSNDIFVQEYVQNPYLVDGHKFDIGVYVVITSVDPLRAYWYKGDVLFRYCPAKYHPFDPNNLDKYVIRDDYMPTWEVPSLAHPHSSLGHGMKDSFDIYVRSKGVDPAPMWEEIQRAIAEAIVMKARFIVDATKRYPTRDSFFEMMRFDLMLDEDLKVYLLEANMSPNLSSEKFRPNQLLYEQILYNLFSLTGISRKPNVNGANFSDPTAASNMVSAQKNIAVFGDQCSTECREDCERIELCKLCKQCLSKSMRTALLRAHSEFLHRGDFRRLIPPPMEKVEDMNLVPQTIPKEMSPADRLQHLWYQGKCNQDITWCT